MAAAPATTQWTDAKLDQLIAALDADAPSDGVTAKEKAALSEVARMRNAQASILGERVGKFMCIPNNEAVRKFGDNLPAVKVYSKNNSGKVCIYLPDNIRATGAASRGRLADSERDNFVFELLSKLGYVRKCDANKQTPSGMISFGNGMCVSTKLATAMVGDGSGAGAGAGTNAGAGAGKGATPGDALIDRLMNALNDDEPTEAERKNKKALSQSAGAKLVLPPNTKMDPHVWVAVRVTSPEVARFNQERLVRLSHDRKYAYIPIAFKEAGGKAKFNARRLTTLMVGALEKLDILKAPTSGKCDSSFTDVGGLCVATNILKSLS